MLPYTVYPTLNVLAGNATGLDAGKVRLHLQGRFTLARSQGALDLGHARVNLWRLLDEGTPAGELVEAVGPYGTRLVPRGSRGSTTVFSEQPPPGASPIFRLEVTRRSGRVLDFNLNVARSDLSGEPERCSATHPAVTDLATRFFIYDKQGRPVDVATTEPRECIGAPQDPSALLLQ